MGPSPLHHSGSWKPFHPRRQETQPLQLPAHPHLFHYARNTVSPFRAMEHKIQEDYCSKTCCLLGVPLQYRFFASEVQKSSLTLTIACSSAPRRRPLLRGKLGKHLCSEYRRDEARIFSFLQTLCLCLQTTLASERSLNISTLQ